MNEPLLEVRGLAKAYRLGSGSLQALRGVDLRLGRGESLGLAGESGCGKTTLARCILRLERPDAGAIDFAGEDLLALGGRALRSARRRVQLVFQDAGAALNPRRRVGASLVEPLLVHGLAARAERPALAAALLERVGLDPALARRHPHELSGGQRQRVGIARALATEPELLVADEPVSALDVSVQAQILNLLADIRARTGLSLLLISHDLAVLRQVCDRIAVMYLGRIVEIGPAAELLAAPRHPYTKALLAARPRLDPGAAAPRRLLEGDPPSAAAIPAGCPFHPRCPEAFADCRVLEPASPAGSARQGAACLLPAALSGQETS